MGLDGQDPLVHGPKPAGPETRGPLPKADPGFEGIATDLSSRSPWDDARTLLSRPKLFFRALASTKREGPLYLKAILVFVLLSWLGQGLHAVLFQQAGLWGALDELARNLNQNEIPARYSMLLRHMPLDEWWQGLRGVSAAVQGLMTLLSPLGSLAWMGLASLVATFWLRRLSAAGERVELGAVFLSQVYASWFVALGIVPFLGGLVAALFVFFFSVYSLAWMYDTSFLRAFISIRFLEILMFLLAMGAIAILILFLSLTLA